MIDDITASRLAAELLRARRARYTLAPLTDRIALTMDDAYRIQRLVTATRVARGGRVVGWKLGYTSAAMREQMGVEQPNFGPRTDAMLLDDGSVARNHLTQPRVEPEIGFFLARPLGGADITRDDALAAVEVAVACLEVVDSVYRATASRSRTTPPTARRLPRSSSVPYSAAMSTSPMSKSSSPATASGWARPGARLP